MTPKTSGSTNDEPAEPADTASAQERRSPALIAAAVALPVALVVGVIVAAVLANSNPAKEPVALAPVPAPAATSPECAALLAALPNSLGDFTDAELAQPAPTATKAWQRDDGSDPIVLRCGLDRPDTFDSASVLQGIKVSSSAPDDEVQWFQVSGADQSIAASTWFVVDRGIYVAMTTPDGAGPTPIQTVTDVVAKTMPRKDIDPAPLPN
ncbi:DUF3515 domain-containing protein [Antrihabitans sp. NCIMB 15449]|uniref:DUF3515 domain-containing protein n=1 Tax=Antrihabitans spumae TaxID=3373370 RepID=A0ABW7JNR0_9NOCA